MELAEAPKRIAVIQTAHLHDVVFVAPLVRVLKLAWPAAHLILVTRSKAVALGACVPGVDEVVSFDRSGDSGLSGLKRIARDLGELQLVVVAHPALRCAVLGWLTKAPVRVGNDTTVLRRFFTVQVPLRPREPVVERSMDLARALGIEGPMDLKLAPPALEVEKAARLLGEAPSVGLVVGGDWPTKRWPVASWSAFADRVTEAGLRPLLLGGSEEKPIAEAIKKAARPGLLDLVGNTLVESVAVMSRCRGVVGSDSGLTHAARAVGTPTLLLYGPTDPGGHTLENHAQAIRLGLDCQPCEEKGAKACPLKHRDCLRKLDADRVWRSFADLMGRGR